MTWHVERSVGGRVWREDEREAAFRALGEAVVRGHQAIVAFPITRAGTDLLDLREASALAATLKREVLGEVEVALFHGAMTAGEREAAVSGLASGKVRVIIATTLMEILPPLERPVDVLIEHSDRMDLQRLLSWRRLITPQGRMHFVVGGQPRPWGLRAVERLALGEPDEEVVAACPEGFPPLGEEPAGGGLSGAWCIAADADLIPLARGVAHALLRADPQCREALGAMWWRLAWSAWDRVGGGLNPLPPARPVAGRKRRRRRKRRGVA